MSVDFEECDKCEESKYDEYVGRCGGEMGQTGCGKSLCTNCLINDDIDSSYAYEYGTRFDGTPEQLESFELSGDDYNIGDMIDDTGIDPKYCPYCSGKEVHDDEILEFLLNDNGVTREDIKQIILDKRAKAKK